MRRWLLPLSQVYSLAARLDREAYARGWRQVERLGWPVVSVGSLSAGGAGKTPLTIALARLLAGRGLAVDVLSRGYGRSSRKAVRVEPGGRAALYGDEPLLIARDARVPVYVAPARVLAGRLAEAESSRAGLHLLDDGFEHHRLARDLDIVLVSSRDLADRVLPAGELREPLSALRRADAFAIEEADTSAAGRLAALGLEQPRILYRRNFRMPATGSGPVVAFCGIAHGERFRAALEQARVPVARFFEFPDHHRYSRGEYARLAAAAAGCRARALVTTGKDMMRLEAEGRAELEAAAPLLEAGHELELADADAIWRLLAPLLSA
jgi:tetraacyldisaccharide 4'-kinase